LSRVRFAEFGPRFGTSRIRDPSDPGTRGHGGAAGGIFDHVFVCFLLEHLAQPVEALRRLSALVRPAAA